MKLKLDENLGSLAADFFREAGHDIATVRSEGLAGSTDRHIISICQVEKRCLVTLDLDFSNPLVFDPLKFFGIAVFRLPSPPTWNDLLAICRSFHFELSQRDIIGKLWVVQKDRIREYTRRL